MESSLPIVSSFPIIILGGGIHGISISYYLSLLHIPSLIIEQDTIGAGASSKAGGFLARDWGDDITSELHTKSFALMQGLAKELGLTSYRVLPTMSVSKQAVASSSKSSSLSSSSSKSSSSPRWLDRSVNVSTLDDNQATAQVTPFELLSAMYHAANQRTGSQVLIGTCIGINYDGTDRASEDEDEGQELHKVVSVNVRISSSTSATTSSELASESQVHSIACNKVIVALGPWSSVFCEDHFGFKFPMDGVKSTSIIYKDIPWINDDACACFCEEDEKYSCHLELYPRNNDELYICGCGGSDYVNGDRLREGGDCARPRDVIADPARVAAAKACLQEMSRIGDVKPDIEQACMRPCPGDAIPLMGNIPGTSNAYISCGHNCWGILWAPISGLAMSELVAEGACRSVDLSPFDPARFVRRKTSGRRVRGRHQIATAVGEQW